MTLAKLEGIDHPGFVSNPTEKGSGTPEHKDKSAHAFILGVTLVSRSHRASSALSDPVPLPPGLAAARLAYMKQSVLHYDIRPGDDRSAQVPAPARTVPAIHELDGPWRRHRLPLVRRSRPARNRGAGVVKWSLELDPRVLVALAQAIHCSIGPRTRRDPVDRRCRVQARPRCPTPLRHPRAAAYANALPASLPVEDNFHRQSLQPLRLLSKPFARYDSPKSGVL